MKTTPERVIDPILETLEGGGPPRVQREIFGFRLYDQIIARDLTEIPEIMAAVGETQGPILELASGSGRLTRHLRSAGRELSSGEEDIAAAEGEETYGCVVLGASYATVLEPHSRQLLFRRVNRFLAPDGWFLMTVVNADHRAEPGDINSGATISQLGEDAFLITVESRDAVNGARHVSMSYVSFDECGTYRSSEYSSDITFVSSTLMQEELGDAGLRVVSRRPVRIGSRAAGVQSLELWVCARTTKGPLQMTPVRERP